MQNKIIRNSYIKQIATLMSGTLIAQIVMLIFIPVITHIYTPIEFGTYSLFLSLVNIIGLVSSFKYDQAIMLPKNEDNAKSIVILCLIIVMSVTFFSSLIVIFFYDLIVAYFNGKSDIVVFIPVGILLVGMMQFINAYTSRNQEYKELAKMRVLNACTITGFQTGSKYFFKFDGLVYGKLIADFLTVAMLIKLHKNRLKIFLAKKSRIKRRILINLKRYSHFPKYQSFTVFLNALSQSAPILLLTLLYSAEIAGYYALTVRVLQAPIGLVGGATREVYYQKAARLHAAGENILNLYLKTSFSLFKLFILPFFVFLFFGKDIFIFIFGNNWELSGVFSQILIVWFLFSFVNSPSVMTYSILKLQKIQMYIEIVSIILRILSIYIGFLIFQSFFVSIELFIFSSVLINVFIIFYIYKKLKE